MMAAISAEEFFDYPQEALEFAQLSHGYGFYQSKGLAFVEGCDDLDYYMASYLRLPSGRRLVVTTRHKHPIYSDRVGIIAHANDPNPIDTLDEFLRCIGETREIVRWLSPYLTGQRRWILVRQDDHGNRFMVGHFWDRNLAETALRHYSQKHHKQEYWLEEAEPIFDSDNSLNSSPWP